MSLKIDAVPAFNTRELTNYNTHKSTQTNSLRSTSQTQSSKAAVVDISTKAMQSLEKSMAENPLSDQELKDLYDVYLKVGEGRLIKNITQELEHLSKGERALALSVMAGAGSREEISDVMDQIQGLQRKDLNPFLWAAKGAGKDLGDFLEITGRLRGEQRTQFFVTAEYLTKASNDQKNTDLKNYILAAGSTGVNLDELIQKTMTLKKESRTHFLAGAATAGDEVDRLMKLMDQLEDPELLSFLKSTAHADKGIKNLLTLAEDLEGDDREAFIRFASNLEGHDTRNFLSATKGNKEMAERLTDTGGDLKGSQRSKFFLAAAGAGKEKGRLTTMVKKLTAGSQELDNFLTSALKSGGRLKGFLDISEQSSGSERYQLFSYTAELSTPDMTNFVLTSEKENLSAHILIQATQKMDGKDKSYLLYAATLTGKKGEDLIKISGSLSGDERTDFLFTAANSGEGADDFLKKAGDFSGQDQKEYLMQEKNRVILAEGSSLKKEYIYLSSSFDESELSAILKAGKNIDTLLANMEKVGMKGMDAGQQKNLMFIASRSGHNIEKLYATAAKLEQKELDAYIDFAVNLTGNNLGNFITVAAEVVGLFNGHLGNLSDSHANMPDGSLKPADSGRTLTTLIEIAKGLGKTEQEDFLAAAANAGDEIQSLMNMTQRLAGVKQTTFLTGASAVQKNVQAYLKATEKILLQDLNNFTLAANKLDRTPKNIILEETDGFTLVGVEPKFLFDFLGSAAYMGGNSEDWLKGFLG